MKDSSIESEGTQQIKYGEAVRKCMKTLPSSNTSSNTHSNSSYITSSHRMSRPSGVPPATVIRASIKPDFMGLFKNRGVSDSVAATSV